MKIVCIEPDVVLARQYKKVLSSQSENHVVICLDPQIAIDLIDQQRPDVIIMELQLIPLSGLAFLHELRSYEDLHDIPVIIYSAIPKDSFRADAQTWKDMGVKGYFYKVEDSIHKVARAIQ